MADIEVIVVGPFAHETGGIARYVREVEKRLSSSVEVTPHDNGSRPGDGLRWLVTSVAATIANYVQFVVNPDGDVVHVNTSDGLSFLRAAFYALYAGRLCGIPVVLHVHGSEFDTFVRTQSPFWAAIQAAVFDASSEVIVLSEYWADLLTTNTALSELRVVPNAVDVSEYDPSYDDESSHLVFVSNLIPRKGISDLLSALSPLVDEDRLEISIAGDGDLSPEVSEFADNHDSVHYLGYISEQEKVDLLSEGSIYALPTYAEGLPIGLLEGMAGGNAVVSTPVGSIPEVVGEGNGTLIEPGDIDALREAIRIYVESPSKAAAAGRRNHELVAKSYSWERVTSELREVYDDAVRTEVTA